MAKTDVAIREFRAGDEAAFRALNEEWIVRNFVLEPRDRASLNDPRGAILERGGRIFMAEQEGQAVGCCALLPLDAPGEYEVAKMAVTESRQGAGIGREILRRAIAEARAAGARRLCLETNGKLAPAIRLYESLGFRHIPKERVVPSPYARADVHMELFL
jgi:putative acetyltransferase